MSADIRADPRYQELIARQRAIVEPGWGRPVDIEVAEVSPDGLLVAVVVRIGEPSGHGRTELRLLPADAPDGSGSSAAAEATILTGPGGDASCPRWSLDGRLAWLADHGHRHIPTPRVAVRSTDGSWATRELSSPPGIPEHLRWSPDGTRLLLVMAGLAAEQADGLGSGTVGQEVEEDTPTWWPEVESSDGGDEWRSAWILGVEDGSQVRVSPEATNVWEADWIGNHAVVAVVTEAPAEDAWYRSRLVRLGPGSGEVAILHVPEWPIQFAEGSPDASRVAVIEGVSSDRYFTVGRLVVAQADGSGSWPLDAAGDDVAAFRWTGPDGLVAVAVDGMETSLLELDPGRGGGPGRATELHRTNAEPAGSWVQVSAAAGRVVLPLSGPSEPVRVVQVRDGVATTLFGTEHPGRALAWSAFAERRVVEWAAPDGTRVEGLLALPHGDPPFATVLWVHGGPVGWVGMGFPGSLGALLADAGYAVLFPNPRGSVGRGRAYAAAVVGDMGGPADSGDLLAGVDHLVAMGIADPERLVVGGVSYGGYMASLLPAIDDRFAAAIVGSPLTDLISSYYGSSLTVFVHDYVGCRPTDDLVRYVERSSVFAGARLRTPTLISVGRRDRATPPGQAYEHFRAVRQQGTPVELLVYPEEGHAIRATEAAMDWAARVVMWLEHFAPARR